MLAHAWLQLLLIGSTLIGIKAPAAGELNANGSQIDALDAHQVDQHHHGDDDGDGDATMVTVLLRSQPKQQQGAAADVTATTMDRPLSKLFAFKMKTAVTPAHSMFSAIHSGGVTQSNPNNVVHLVRSIDERLRAIRNVEMGVTVIQEIFDSRALAGVSGSDATAIHRRSSVSVALARTLQNICQRLSKKLQTASHIVRTLREFLRINITELANEETPLRSRSSPSSAEDFQRSPRNGELLFLSTLVESGLDSSTATSNDSEQVEILNRLKSISFWRPQRKSGAQSANYRSLEASRRVLTEMRRLRSPRQRADATKIADFAPTYFKQMYFLSRSDHASYSGDQPAHRDQRLRHLYLNAIANKVVLLLIDVGSAISVDHLELMKLLVENIVRLLNDADQLAIVTISNEASHLVWASSNRSVHHATQQNKEHLLNLVGQLRPSGQTTNYTLGFEFSFRLLQQLQHAGQLNATSAVQFLHLTRALLANRSDAPAVLATIAAGQAHLIRPVVINTCAVTLGESATTAKSTASQWDDGKRAAHERQFLRDIAQQDYERYNIETGAWRRRHVDLSGSFCVVDKEQSQSLARTATAIFQHLFTDAFLSPRLQVQLPMGDDKDSVVAMTHAASSFGVVGIDLYRSDLAEDVDHYVDLDTSGTDEYSYAFLMDRRGHVIAHPALGRVQANEDTPLVVDIALLENATDFDAIRRRLLREDSGNATTMAFAMRRMTTVETLERTYLWQGILDIYVVCLVWNTKPAAASSVSGVGIGNIIMDSYRKPSVSSASSVTSSSSSSYQTKISLPFMTSLPAPMDDGNAISDLLYHRLDLLPPQTRPLCRYFRQLATLDASTLYLSARSFELPFAYLHNSRQGGDELRVRTVESIMAYLKDTTGLLANPGLRAHIRDDTTAVRRAMGYLKKRHRSRHEPAADYIIRRYVATVNGVLQVYPGCLLPDDYDPINRPWYRKAMEHSGKVVATEPYLDVGGAGYVVTIAHTILEGKANALHSAERDRPMAIVALDMPYSFLYKLINDSAPLCRKGNIRCLLFEDSGYLVAHPSMMEYSSGAHNARRPREHLTRKESFLANDILNHKGLVRKVACANYERRTVQRRYAFNTSLAGVLTNVVHGERTKYSIALVRGTNLFAAVLNSTCDGEAFCPCSTVDHTCINCNRMEQTECECPCECPMDENTFINVNISVSVSVSATINNYTMTQHYPCCEPANDVAITLPRPHVGITATRPCLSLNCDVYGAQSDCLTAIGCEWCQLDVDGSTFETPFCASQLACFNGVLSSRSAYAANGDDDDTDMLAVHHIFSADEDRDPTAGHSYSAFGPVGGAITVLALVIAFAVYCYRHNVEAHGGDDFYANSLHDENYALPQSRLNFADCHAYDEMPDGCGNGDSGASAAGRHRLLNSANISPYHMSSTASSYHRPPNGESDHGYSTMTPHDDFADQQSFTLAEPLLLLSEQRRHSRADSLSIATTLSSPTIGRQQQQTRDSPAWRHQAAASMGKDSTVTLAHINRTCEQTLLPSSPKLCEDRGQRHILAAVTVHRHMETTES